ncbi:MAG: glycosyltransferase family 39 protein [Candidatus Eremiobacteraeota bacterium]|nr:glycosyltransferase family 39 protein [Candidatus Eremiobacteraeota bacterium]
MRPPQSSAWKLWAVLALAAIMRVVPAVRRPLQVDEAYALHVASLPIAHMLHAIATLDVHPPLFWLVLHPLVVIGVPDLALRLCMAALGVGCVALLAWLVRLWHSDTAALIAAFCAAVMPSLIFYDITIRMYVLFDCFTLLSFALLSFLCTRDDLSVEQRRAAWWGWTLCTVLLLYTQYLAFTVIAAQLLYIVLLRRDALVRSLAGTAAACVLWLPQLPIFLQQLPRGGLAFPFYEHHELSALYELAGQATIGVQTHGAAYMALWTSLVAWLWFAGAAIIGLPGNRRSLAVWLLVPAAITLVYGLLAHKLLFVDRYYLVFALGLCALTGIAVQRLGARSVAGAVAGVALAAMGALYAFDSDYYTADWPGVAGVLKARAQTGDLIVFDQGSPYFALNRLHALDGHPLILVFRRADVAHIPKLARPFHRVWLVLFQSGPVDPQARILHDLAAVYHPAGYWEYLRRLPAEGASVVLFVR